MKYICDDYAKYSKPTAIFQFEALVHLKPNPNKDRYTIRELQKPHKLEK